jgi:predicted permease
MSALVLILVRRLVPLYLLIPLGALANRRLKVEKEPIAALLIYFIAPVVLFSSLLDTPLTPSRLSLPLFTFLVASLVGALAFRFAPLRRQYRGILALASGSCNAGFFGLPVTIYLFGEKYAGLAILCGAGFVTYENSLGFFFAARGRHTARESLRRVARLPTVYAVGAGVIGHFAGLRLSGEWAELARQFRGAYIILGMLIIGLAMGRVNRVRIHPRYLAYGFALKFLFWPLLVGGLLALDSHSTGFYDPDARRILHLMAILPMPAIAVAIAAAVDAEPEETAILVLAGTLFALLLVPLIGGRFS